MPDLKQELADVQAAIEKMPPAPGKVRMRHPLTGDTQDVDANPAALVPWMTKGYSQENTPAAPANGE